MDRKMIALIVIICCAGTGTNDSFGQDPDPAPATKKKVNELIDRRVDFKKLEGTQESTENSESQSCEIDPTLYMGNWTLHSDLGGFVELGEQIQIQEPNEENQVIIQSSTGNRIFASRFEPYFLGPQFNTVSSCGLRGVFREHGCVHWITIRRVDTSSGEPDLSCDGYFNTESIDLCLQLNEGNYSKYLQFSIGHFSLEGTPCEFDPILHGGHAHAGGTGAGQ